MIEYSLIVGQFVLVISLFISIYRMIIGPTTMDRVLSFDAFAISVVGLMVLLYIKWKSPFYMDLIILFSLFGFFGTVAFAYFLNKTYSIDKKETPS